MGAQQRFVIAFAIVALHANKELPITVHGTILLGNRGSPCPTAAFHVPGRDLAAIEYKCVASAKSASHLSSGSGGKRDKKKNMDGCSLVEARQRAGKQ